MNTNVGKISKFLDAVLLHKWWTGIGGVIAVLSLSLTVVALHDTGTSNRVQPTLPSNLEMHAARYDETGQVGAYVLPWNAPLKTFPREPSPGCNNDQVNWLRTHGREVPPAYALTVRNTASSGGMISFDNIHVQDLSVSPAPTGILFLCPNAGMGDLANLTLDLDQGGRVSFTTPHGPIQGGGVFAFNLAPGEEGHVEVNLSGLVRNARGRISADVHSGTLSSTVPLPVFSGSGAFFQPGIGAKGIIVEFDGTSDFFCSTQKEAAANDFHGCSADAIQREVGDLRH